MHSNKTAVDHHTNEHPNTESKPKDKNGILDAYHLMMDLFNTFGIMST